MVATDLREPWCSSILMRFFLGCTVLARIPNSISRQTYVREADRQVAERLGQFSLIV